MATSPDDLGPDRRFNPVTALAVVAGVLVLLFLVWFMFLRADDADVETVAPAPAPAVTTPEPEETVEPPKRNGPVETFEVFAPKDPFDPLISAAAAPGAASDGPSTEETAPGDGSTATTPGDGTTTTTTTTPGGGNGGGESVGGHRVRVIDVFARGGSRRAQVQVDGTVYTVDEGERFAQNFQLLSTSGQCATMLFGDDEFTLCEGEEILK